MTAAHPIPPTTTGTRHPVGTPWTGADARDNGPFRAPARGVRGRALLAALGLALAAAVLPAAAHASPQAPTVEPQLANPGGNPQPPEPPDPPDWGPEDVVNPTEQPEPPLPPDPPEVPDWGPDDVTNPTGHPEPPQPPDPPDGPDDLVNPTLDPDPTPPGGGGRGDGSIPVPERVDAGFGGAAVGRHHAAGLALIGAGLVLALLVVVAARRLRAEAAGSDR